MELELIHDKTDMNSTGWKLAVNGVFECYALGLPREFEGAANVREKTSIPYGRYPVEVGYSPHMQMDCIHILNVPDRDNILIHIANRPSEILGCFAVGKVRGTDQVAASKLANDALLDKVVEALKTEPVFVTVKPAEES